MGNPVLDNSENENMCYCHECPTYKKSNLSNSLFCARGNASQKVFAADCLCQECPVSQRYSLNQMYYCMKGKSAEIKE